MESCLDRWDVSSRTRQLAGRVPTVGAAGLDGPGIAPEATIAYADPAVGSGAVPAAHSRHDHAGLNLQVVHVQQFVRRSVADFHTQMIRTLFQHAGVIQQGDRVVTRTLLLDRFQLRRLAVTGLREQG
jgi:hypothetical protein